MRRTLGFSVVAFAAVFFVAACGSRSASATPEEAVTIVVDNQNFYDATVYLRWYSDRRRLGVVGGYNARQFDTRWQGPEIQVEVDLLAGGTYRGDRISVSPGETIEVVLPPNLDRLITRR